MECIDKLDGAVIVTDADGTLIYLNEKALRQYEKEGGKDLIGRKLAGCHSERSNQIIQEMIRTGKNNVYTIEKKGKKKLIFQSPWMVDGEFRGLIELSLEIPFDMPHYVRG
ncbi:MAG TPA: PAS domain-containing protein [Bacteroidales bacterium]|jgi:transcriptional regulator with PAS, ATPase and Fis domain|nr:PAS domain-containing protein [Bacteroidales bacterium]